MITTQKEAVSVTPDEFWRTHGMGKTAAVDSGGRNGYNIGKKRGGRLLCISDSHANKVCGSLLKRSPLRCSLRDKPSSLVATAVYFCVAMARIKKIRIKIKII